MADDTPTFPAFSVAEEYARAKQNMLEQDAQKYRQNGTGRVTFKQCPVCGYVEMRQVTADGHGYELIRREKTDPCPRCVEAAQRSPELYKWVLNAIAHNLYYKGRG